MNKQLCQHLSVGTWGLSVTSCCPRIARVEINFNSQHPLNKENMSDPIPSATADPEIVEKPLSSNAEDRKAAAALSSLHTNEIATEGAPIGAPVNANQEALGRAMSRLEIAAGQGSDNKTTVEVLKTDEVVKKKAVKVAPADVTLLVCLPIYLGARLCAALLIWL